MRWCLCARCARGTEVGVIAEGTSEIDRGGRGESLSLDVQMRRFPEGMEARTRGEVVRDAGTIQERRRDVRDAVRFSIRKSPPPLPTRTAGLSGVEITVLTPFSFPFQSSGIIVRFHIFDPRIFQQEPNHLASDFSSVVQFPMSLAFRFIRRTHSSRTTTKNPQRYTPSGLADLPHRRQKRWYI